MAQYEAGELQAARETLSQIDAITLTREERQKLYTTLIELEERIAAGAPAVPAPAEPAPAPAAPAAEEAPADAAAMLAQADAVAEEDPGTAIALYNAVMDAGGPEAETARARMADLLRNLNSDLTTARRLLDEAEADLAAGRLDNAESKYLAVGNSGVELGWFDQQRIARGTDRIAEARLEAGQVEPAPAPAPVAETPRPTPAPVVVTPVPAVTESNDLFTQARKAAAQDYLADAQEAMNQGYDQLAVNLLAKAEELDPNNPAIRNALEEAAGAQGAAPQLVNVVDRFEITRSATKAQFEEAMNSAETKLAAGDFGGASTDAARAKTSIESKQEFFSISEYEAMRQRATDLSVQINKSALAAQVKRDEELRKKQEDDQAAALARAKEQNRKEVRDLIRKARELQKEMRYAEALQLLDRALFIEPTNFTAEVLKEIIEESKLAVDYRKTRREFDLTRARDRLLNLEATIPYTEIIRFPEDWPELSEKRINGLDDSGKDSAANRETALKLKKSVPISFDANPLESVVDYIRETTGANIFVNWPALAEAGIEQDTPISLTLTNVQAEKALELVLQAVSAQGFDEIGYSIIDGVVTISTAEQLRRSTDLRVYDIRDLLVEVPDFNDAPEFDLTESLSNTNSGGGGGGGGSSIFGDEDDSEDEEQPTRQERIDDIIALIEETVGEFDDWEINGGDSSVRELNSNLIIKTTSDNHRRVLGLLSQLRETRAIQISVEARFLLVDRNFLDELTVDFDMAWQGQPSDEVRDNPLFGLEQVFNADGTPAVIPGTQTPFFFQPTASPGFSRSFAAQGNNSLAEAVEGSLSYAPFFSGAPGLNLGISFIDDISVNFLVEATLANRNSVSLTAPRVTFFNGQRAYVVVARQVAFVSDLEPIPDTDGFDITTSVVQSGVVLDVQGTVSADRRYVTLTLRPSLADIAEIVEFPVEGGNTTIIDGVIQASVFDLAIQLPTIDITEVRATVSVPDRGTLLVGGQRLVGEVEIESGVPVLSKVPLLNRLFTSKSKTEDERTLLILIKPTIIIQNEREEDLFPGITDNLLDTTDLGGGF